MFEALAKEAHRNHLRRLQEPNVRIFSGGTDTETHLLAGTLTTAIGREAVIVSNDKTSEPEARTC